MFISWMLTTLSFQKSLIVEEFQGNYLKRLLQSFLANRFSRLDGTVLPVPVTSTSARSSSPPSPTRAFWHDKSSQNPSPAVNFKRAISLKRFRYLLAAFRFRAEIGRLRARNKNCEPGEGYVKICRVKKHVWEMEGSLSARWLTSLAPVKRYHHVAKTDLRKNFAKDG